MKHSFLRVLSIPCIIALFNCNSHREQSTNNNLSQRNILFIYSDEHAFQAISTYKSFLTGVVETPNQDRLAVEGMLFENPFCTNSICSPTRISVLTGKYSHKYGVKTIEDKFDGNQEKE